MYRLSSTQTRPPTRWDYRPRTSWITWSTTSTTPSPESSTTPFMRKHLRASLPPVKELRSLLFVCVCVCVCVCVSACALRSEDKLANVNSTRQYVGKLAASLSSSFTLQQPNAFLYCCSLHLTHFCVTADYNTQQSLGLNQPAWHWVGGYLKALCCLFFFLFKAAYFVKGVSRRTQSHWQSKKLALYVPAIPFFLKREAQGTHTEEKAWIGFSSNGKTFLSRWSCECKGERASKGEPIPLSRGSHLHFLKAVGLTQCSHYWPAQGYLRTLSSFRMALFH